MGEKFTYIQSDLHLVAEPIMPPLLERNPDQNPDPFLPFEGAERVTYQAYDVCNLQCSGCFLSPHLGINGHDGPLNKQRRVGMDQFKKHLRALGPGLEEFFLLGAEPTAYPVDSNQMLRYAHEELGVDIMLVTNASVRPERLDKVMENLPPQEIHKLNISIDSIENNVHDHLRGREGALSKTLENTKRYIELGYPVKIQTTVWEQNYATILDTVKRLHDDFGANRFAFHAGSVESLPQNRKNDVSHIDPLAWRALCEQLYQFRQANLDSLIEFNFPFVYFTETELKKYLFGNDELFVQYKEHVERVEQGENESMPFLVCPATQKPQIYLFANDGPNNEGEISLCQIHSMQHPGMHHAQYSPEKEEFAVNRNPDTSQMKNLIESPHMCPAMPGATGQESDRVRTMRGDYLYHGCRYPGSNQVPYIPGQFSLADYQHFCEQYGRP